MYINKADQYCKDILTKILNEGSMDVNPRPKWPDGTPAHSLSINGYMCQYDLSKGELPLMTLRPVAIKNGIKEILWIYQDQTSDLEILRNKYGVNWWNEWALSEPNELGHDTIGATYGQIVKDHDLMNRYVLDSIAKNPDSRYHIINLWNPSSQLKPHGLKPCAMMTQFMVRHGKDGKTYLDSSLYQRSCDYLTAASGINAIQYAVFNMMVAHHFNMLPGVFTHFMMNIQIYDRHIPIAEEILKRESIEVYPKITINPEKKNFYDITIDDIKIEGYDIKKIAEINPQVKLEVAI
jgi:thymidylate synthase